MPTIIHINFIGHTASLSSDSASTSSDSKAHLFLQNHPLVVTDCTRVSWKYFEDINVINYNLDQLLACCRFPKVCDGHSVKVTASTEFNCIPIT